MWLMPCKTVREWEWDPTIVIKVQPLAILTLNLTWRSWKSQNHQDSQLERVGMLHPSGRTHVTAAVTWQRELLPRDCGRYQLKAITATESSRTVGFIQFHTDISYGKENISKVMSDMQVFIAVCSSFPKPHHGSGWSKIPR